MAIFDYYDPDSITSDYIEREVIVYAMTYIPLAVVEITKQVKPSYPQARKNKRDNFKVK